MIQHIHLDPRAKSKSKSKSRSTLVSARLSLFGEPLLLEDEDGVAYEDLLARIFAAVKPVDVIDEILIFDVVALEWELLRWRRLKLGFIRTRGLGGLQRFLNQNGNLDYEYYRERFTEDLAEILQNSLPEDQAKEAQTLADKCSQNEPDAADKVNAVLAGIHRDMDNILNCARRQITKELVQAYARREPDATKLITELLAGAGVSIASLVADALSEKLDAIERIDRLTLLPSPAAMPPCARSIAVGRCSARQ